MADAPNRWSPITMSKDVLKNEAPRRVTVIYDGSCDLCMAIAKHFSALPAVCDIEWRGEVPTSDEARVGMRFRVVDTAGTESHDTEARLLLLSLYPRYKIVSQVLSARPLRGLVTLFFNCISDYRYVVSRGIRLFKRKGVGQSSLCDGSGDCGSSKKR